MAEEIPSEFLEGVEQFNQGEFYACHDTLEALWMEASEPQKKFYQGILQIAVACYHFNNCNWRGAVILLGEGINKLGAYEPIYSGIDVTHLLTQSREMLSVLQQAGQEKISDLVEQIKNGSSNSLVLPTIVPIVNGQQGTGNGEQKI